MKKAGCSSFILVRSGTTIQRKLNQLGPDTGWDSIGTFDQGKPLSKFLNGLDTRDKLTKTILYNPESC